MASLNKVFLLGNLTRDPDLRGLSNGQNVCELGVAVSRRYVNGSGQEVEDTCFVDVVVWGRAAANCKQYLAKGSQVMVEGRLQQDRWEDRNSGGTRTKLRVVADQVQFMNRRPQQDNPYSQPQQGNYPPPAQGNYPPPRGDANASRQGAYPPPRNDAPPFAENPGGNYSRSARPAAPPMPDPSAEGGAGAESGVDDIPF